jgi:hypothetical protein
MATWAEVKKVVLGIESFKAEQRNEHLVSGVVDLPNGRSQSVFVGGVGDRLILMSIICPLSAVNLDKLFEIPAVQEMPYGLNAVGDLLVVKHSTLLADLDVHELITPLVEIGYNADILEGAITGGDAY